MKSVIVQQDVPDCLKKPEMRKSSQSRTQEQLRRHYEAEKALASKLRSSTREERRRLYGELYDELFRLVPDHPRLTAPDDLALLNKININKLKLLGKLIKPESVVVEFAPGDCSFAAMLAEKVRSVMAVDISDQRPESAVSPPNMELVIYNGYDLDLPNSFADIVFSDQLIEHLHPDDTLEHFSMARRLLKPDGVYLFRTPHAVSGPHDISRHFSQVAEGFHLKEWTFAELCPTLLKAGFSRCSGYLGVHNHYFEMPVNFFISAEKAVMRLPRALREPVVQNRFRQIIMAAHA